MAAGASALIKHIDRLEDEGVTRRDESPLKDADLNLRFLRGDTWSLTSGPPSPFRPDTSAYRFTMPVLDQLLKRKTALITDSRPTIDIRAYAPKRSGTAATFKTVISALWDEQNFDQSAARELVRAAGIGSTFCLPIWNEAAKHGRGDIQFLMYDPRQVVLDPSITRMIDIQDHADFVIVKEVLSLNRIKEYYGEKGVEVKASSRWSSYGRIGPMNRWRGIASAMQRSYRKQTTANLSAVPRQEVRHTWFRDFQRDDRLQPRYGVPQFIRYVVDAGGVELKDEALPYVHGQIPVHGLDWGIELEHPHGASDIAPQRRLQYTLNRLVGQVVDNILLTNRVKVVADADALDSPTWQKIAENANGIFIKKRQGRQVDYALPQNAVPQYIVPVIQMLLQAVDIVSGMTEVTRGVAPKGNTSGIAIEGLQLAAQSIIRLEARAFESWLERIFQQVIALIWQYFTSNRIMHVVGPNQEYVEYLFDRAAFEMSDDGAEKLREEAWQDFQFKVLPGSSLAMTRVQKGVLAANLYGMGLITGEEVLRAAEWPNPKEARAAALKERAEMGPLLGGPGGGKPKPPRFPNTSRRSVGMS